MWLQIQVGSGLNNMFLFNFTTNATQYFPILVVYRIFINIEYG